ncbi:MAG: DNA translocase FtsK [Acidimicrobiia bacterium]
MLVVAVIAGLAIWGGAAGPGGEVVASASRALMGVGAALLPLLLAAAGVALIADRENKIAVRAIIGGFLAAWAALALAHLVSGTPPLDAPVATLESSGGILGGLAAVPAHAVVGAPAAVVVFVALFGVGVLIASGRRLSQLGPPVRRFARWLFISSEDDAATAATRATATPAPTPIINLAELDSGAEATDEVFDVEALDRSQPCAKTKTTTRHGGSETEPGTAGEPEQLALSAPRPSDAERYELPALDILNVSGASDVDHARLEERSDAIGRTMEQFGVTARVTGITAGPTVARYEIELAEGVKVNKFTNLVPDLRYALGTPDVRVLAPIPGKRAIGLEVPNADRKLVTVGDILTSAEAGRHPHALDVALGRDISGKPVFVNLGKMPHVLIAGATGAGKSSVINSILTSMLCRARPSEVRMILVDPKRVELSRYARVPHLLTGVVTQPKRAADALTWAVQEMDRRYGLLASVGARDIQSYNPAVARGEISELPDGSRAEALPYIVVVIDELADLMLVAAKSVEDSICRLAQLARAVGVHLVIATQRPSVDVITGLIKANIPSRIALKVRTQIDSRTILDEGGAETLVGLGDMLFLGGNANQMERIQGAFVSEGEVKAVVGHWRDQVKARGGAPVPVSVELAGDETAAAPVPPGVGDGPVPLQPVPGPAAVTSAVPQAPVPVAVDESDVVFSGATAVMPAAEDDPDSDPYLAEAMEIVVTSQLGSTSMLQRKLRVGFSRAGRIMDLLEQRGVVGPSEGSKARTVLVAPHELEAAKSRL